MARLSIQTDNVGPIDFRPCFPGILKIIQDATMDNFRGSHDPEGREWPAITEYTVMRSANPYRDPSRPLVDTGNLFEKATTDPVVEETENTLAVGTPAPEGDYGAVHQKGGWNREGRRIPKRQYRGWNRAMIEEVKGIVAKYAAEILRRRGRR